MNRYSLISNNNNRREFLLLQGRGCFHKACRFCHYWEDTSSDPYAENKPAIARVTGQYGVLDVINSGSVHELDEQTLAHLAEAVKQKQIHTLWFEAHYHYRDRLNEIRERFPDVTVKFRTGVESFDHNFRQSMNKGFPDVSPEVIRKDFAGVCLLVCVVGQTKEQIEQDIETAARLFEYFSVNVFNPNSTEIRRDPELYDWFKTEVYPKLKDLKNCEVLIENTDLGVG